MRCGAVCVSLIAFISWPRFDCIISIDTDTSANYKCGHCGWIGPRTAPKTVPSQIVEMLIEIETEAKVNLVKVTSPRLYVMMT